MEEKNAFHKPCKIIWYVLISKTLNFVKSPPTFTSPVKEVTFIGHSPCRTASPQMTTWHLILTCTVLIHSKIYSCQSQYCSNMKPTVSKLSIKPSLCVTGIFPPRNSHTNSSDNICSALLLQLLSLFLRLIFDKTL